MRGTVLRIICAILAVFLFAGTVYADTCPVGRVVYRQNFSDVSTVEASGLLAGTKNAGTFGLHIADGALKIDNYRDERAHVILPFYNYSEDFTIRFSFAFTDVKSANGYFAFMLTCKGDEPSNITSVMLRANGECDGFESVSAKLADDMSKGERVTVTVPVTGGLLDEITVSCAGETESLIIESVTDIVAGNMGFMVRNASAEVYEVAVINGTDYAEESGTYTAASTWTDENPYSGAAVASCSGYSLQRDVSLAAPATGDNIIPVAIIAVLALAGAVFVLKRRR